MWVIIDVSKVKKAVSLLNNEPASEHGEIPSELVKYATRKLWNNYLLYKKYVNGSSVRNAWKLAEILSVNKTGNEKNTIEMPSL